MNILRINHNLKLVGLGIAVAIITSSFLPAHGQESDDYVPEIGWTSRVTSMGLDRPKNVNKKYQFDCQAAPEDLIHAPTWGTKIYTANSGICSAAVHSGMVEAENGGEVTIKLIAGKKFYTGSKKNDVKSKDHNATKISFIFIGKKKDQAEESNSNKVKREPSALERVLMEGFQRGVERSIEKVITDVLK